MEVTISYKENEDKTFSAELKATLNGEVFYEKKCETFRSFEDAKTVVEVYWMSSVTIANFRLLKS